MIRAASIEDGSKIVEIYNHYIENTVTTFEEKSLGNWTS